MELNTERLKSEPERLLLLEEQKPRLRKKQAQETKGPRLEVQRNQAICPERAQSTEDPRLDEARRRKDDDAEGRTLMIPRSRCPSTLSPLRRQAEKILHKEPRNRGSARRGKEKKLAKRKTGEKGQRGIGQLVLMA